MKFWRLLPLIAVTLAGAAERSFPLTQAISATIPVGGGAQCRLLYRKGELKLTAVCGTRRQDLHIPILDAQGEVTFAGQVLVDDYDFDGYQDLMIPAATGYGGVNWFYDFHRYRPASRSFEMVDIPDLEFCNPEARPAEKLIRVACKDGPAWYDDAYKFHAGKPYRYRQNALVVLSGWPDDDEASIYAVTYYGPDQKVLRRGVTSAGDDKPTVKRNIPFDKLILYREPRRDAATASYLIKGDTVEILECLEENDAQWIRLAYQSAKAGRLVRWALMPPG